MLWKGILIGRLARPFNKGLGAIETRLVGPPVALTRATQGRRPIDFYSLCVPDGIPLVEFRMNYRFRQIKSLDSLSASEKQSANEDTAQAKADCCGTVQGE